MPDFSNLVRSVIGAGATLPRRRLARFERQLLRTSRASTPVRERLRDDASRRCEPCFPPLRTFPVPKPTATSPSSKSELEATGSAAGLQLVQGGAGKRGQRRLTKRLDHRRRITATYYVEWVVGTARDGAAMFVIPECDADCQSILARSPWKEGLANRIDDGLRSCWIGISRCLPRSGWPAFDAECDRQHRRQRRFAVATQLPFRLSPTAWNSSLLSDTPSACICGS